MNMIDPLSILYIAYILAFVGLVATRSDCDAPDFTYVALVGYVPPELVDQLLTSHMPRQK
jgi:hypothetical protein